MALGLGAAALIGSGISSAANLLGNELTYQRQKQLNRQKYDDMIAYASRYGATPTSMIQGITGSAGGAVPAVSTAGNPVSDLGGTLNNAIQASAANKQSDAALTNAETEKQLGLMKLKFEPQKYFADVQKSLAQAFEANKNAFLHGSMSQYYKELTKDVVQVRPWKIAGLRQSLINDIATYSKIVQETRTFKAQEGYYNSASHELETRSELNVMQSHYVGAQAFNENLKGFRIQWENDLLSAGIDPSRSFWENTGRLMYSNPKLFKQRMDMFVSALNMLDGRLQDNLGEHYKRNIISGYGLYKLNDIHQKNANSRSYRNSNAFNVISKLIPFMSGGAIPSVGKSGPGVDWWLKD